MEPNDALPLPPDDVDATVARYYPKYAGHLVRYYRVIHDENRGGTWVQLNVYRTTGPSSRTLPMRLRYCSVSEGPVAALEHVPEHPRGQCVSCTAKWRYAHGLGQDVRDMEYHPSYRRDDQMPTLDEVLVGA